MSKAELYVLTVVVLVVEFIIGYMLTNSVLLGVVSAIMCGGIPCVLAIASEV